MEVLKVKSNSSPNKVAGAVEAVLPATGPPQKPASNAAFGIVRTGLKNFPGSLTRRLPGLLIPL